MRMNTIVTATLFAAATMAQAEIVGTTATVRPDNALIVDIQVKTQGRVAKLQVIYGAEGVDPLVSRLTAASTAGPTTITIGRLRANKTYNYTVRAIDEHGIAAGTAMGTFTTGPLPAALAMNSYKLKGHMSVPLVMLSQLGEFHGLVAVDLHGSDAPQIVWYYSNPPSAASGVLQPDGAVSVVEDANGNFIFSDAGTGGPVAADSFYRAITPDGTLIGESPHGCTSITPAPTNAPPGWIWAQGNDIHEVLAPGADGPGGTVLHLGKVVKDPFFEAGLAPQGARLQLATTIRRWDPWTGKDTVVWDPFDFLDPLTERTDEKTSDPTINSNTQSPMPCAGNSLMVEEWTHSNSFQVAPTGEIIHSIRHLDTVLAISQQFDAISWRIGRFHSDFTFPNPSDRFYHQHYARLLENGNLLLFDNGNGRPASEGGYYSRALELALDWSSLTATKVWEYRHPIQNSDGSPGYKYSDAVGMAERLDDGNTLVLFGRDFDPGSMRARSPQTFTLIEADAKSEAEALGVLDMQLPGEPIVYRALPLKTLFGEVIARRP
jgi:hypothetical protein